MARFCSSLGRYLSSIALLHKCYEQTRVSDWDIEKACRTKALLLHLRFVSVLCCYDNTHGHCAVRWTWHKNTPNHLQLLNDWNNHIIIITITSFSRNKTCKRLTNCYIFQICSVHWREHRLTNQLLKTRQMLRPYYCLSWLVNYKKHVPLFLFFSEIAGVLLEL